MCPTAATKSCLWSCVYSSISLCLSLALPAGCVNCADSRFDVDVLYFKRVSHMNTDSLQRKLSNLSNNTSEIQVWSYTIFTSPKNVLLGVTSKLSDFKSWLLFIWLNRLHYIRLFQQEMVRENGRDNFFIVYLKERFEKAEPEQRLWYCHRNWTNNHFWCNQTIGFGALLFIVVWKQTSAVFQLVIYAILHYGYWQKDLYVQPFRFNDYYSLIGTFFESYVSCFQCQ